MMKFSFLKDCLSCTFCGVTQQRIELAHEAYLQEIVIVRKLLEFVIILEFVSKMQESLKPGTTQIDAKSQNGLAE